MGARFLQDVDPYPPDYVGHREFDGYAPMCEFRGCYEPNPKIKTQHSQLSENPNVPRQRMIAYYCSEVEAKEVTFKERGLSREVHNQDRRNRELEALNLS